MIARIALLVICALKLTQRISLLTYVLQVAIASREHYFQHLALLVLIAILPEVNQSRVASIAQLAITVLSTLSSQ